MFLTGNLKLKYNSIQLDEGEPPPESEALTMDQSWGDGSVGDVLALNHGDLGVMSRTHLTEADRGAAAFCNPWAVVDPWDLLAGWLAGPLGLLGETQASESISKAVFWPLTHMHTCAQR